jgi:cytochrome c-type biogenesis protein CcmH
MRDALRELIVAAWLLVAALAPALAVQPDEMLADPALEARARTLSQELRCMVCQNQTIDESEAPLARDLRLLVRERLKSGDSDRQVLDFLVQRYGDFVLLKPPFKWDTALLWLVSPLLLLVGAAGLWPLVRRARNGAAVAAVAPLTAEEDGRLRAVLATDEVSQPVGNKTSSA